MNLQTKKIIAREFLILLMVIGLGIVGFLSTYAYNRCKDIRTENLDKIIVEKELLADSLKILIDRTSKGFTVDQFAEKIKAKYPEYSEIDNKVLVRKVIAKFPIYASSIDISGLKKITDSIDGLPVLNKEKYFQKNWDYYLEIKPAYKYSLGFPPLYKTWKEFEKIKTESIKLKSQKSQIKAETLSFKNQIEFGLKVLIIFSIILFGFRYIIYAIRWSITILKQ